MTDLMPSTCVSSAVFEQWAEGLGRLAEMNVEPDLSARWRSSSWPNPVPSSRTLVGQAPTTAGVGLAGTGATRGIAPATAGGRGAAHRPPAKRNGGHPVHRGNLVLSRQPNPGGPNDRRIPEYAESLR